MRSNATSLADQWRHRAKKWMARRMPPQRKVTLEQRTIYVLPSRNGLLFLTATALVFIAAINYAVSLAFGLAFMMVSLFILAIFHTFNNLNHLSLTAMPTDSVYCGEQIAFNVRISRGREHSYEALVLQFQDGIFGGGGALKRRNAITRAELVDNDQLDLRVFTKATKRGEFKAPYLRVTTYFPLGLVRAWSIVDLELYCLVYPKPIPCLMDQFTAGNSDNDDSAISIQGSEDFYGLRDYVPGDSLRQVAWKNVARGQGLQVKQFVDYVDSKVWLDWDMFFDFSIEERLSRLCYCVLQLSQRNSPFGTKLPGIEIPPGSGPEHRNKLLRTLALFAGK